MAKEKEKPEPTFIDQAFAIIEETYSDNGGDHGMTIMDHKLLVKVLDAHEKYIEDKNNEFHDKLIGDVDEVIGKQWIRVLDEKLTAQTLLLNNTMQSIALDITKIKDRLDKTEEDVRIEREIIDEFKAWRVKAEEWFDRKKRRIEVLETNNNILEGQIKALDSDNIKAYADDLRDMKPYILKWGHFLEWFNSKNKWRIAGIIIGILIFFASLFAVVNLFMHGRGWVARELPKTGMQQIEADIKTGNVSPITRTIHYNKLSDAQNDSIHTRNQEQIKRMIKPVNGMGK